MKIERFGLGPMGTNCYLVENEETQELVIVDPAECPDYMIEYVKKIGYTPKGILLTHAHFDHVMGIDKWVEAFEMPVYLYKEEKQVLENPSLNLSTAFGRSYAYNQEVVSLEDGQELLLAGFRIQVIHTPGHTVGGCCYYVAEEEALFSGDTLFSRSIGRTDFPTGSMATLVRSIKEKLFCLPDEVMVYPGHNEFTCIADEKMGNPFI